jgi:hypothetical protein
MGPLFSGPGNQAPFAADYQNLNNKLLYKMNLQNAPGAEESSQMDFSHADTANAQRLNLILWRDRKGALPMPSARHTNIPDGN